MDGRARPPMPMGCPEMTRVPCARGPAPLVSVCMGAAGRWMYSYACKSPTTPLSTMAGRCDKDCM